SVFAWMLSKKYESWLDYNGFCDYDYIEMHVIPIHTDLSYSFQNYKDGFWLKAEGLYDLLIEAPCHVLSEAPQVWEWKRGTVVPSETSTMLKMRPDEWHCLEDKLRKQKILSRS
ncbi:hypothetical protein CEXT_157681, partial [Caerostris extrusa]